MNKFEKELRRRLAGGDSIQETAAWFIHCMTKTPRTDLTPFEVKFWKRIVVAYKRWKEIHRRPPTRH